MNNEPVAIPFAWYCVWLDENNQPVWDQYEECHPATKQWDNFPDKTIPLYTNPVKELTDEEIISCAEMDFVREELTRKTLEYMWIIEFARAILRKASEK